MTSRRRWILGAAASVGLAQARPKLAFVRQVEGGVTFTRAYTAAPGATRNSIFSGLFPHAGEAAASDRLSRFFEIVQGPGASVIEVAFNDWGQGWSEAAMHIPLSIRVPGKLEGSRSSDALLSTIDVLPTLLALTGQLPDPDLPGRAIDPANPQSSIYCEGSLGTPDEWRAIIRGFDKMITNTRLQPLHLFNLAEDPGEQNDLAKIPGYRLRVDELRALMADWKRRSGDGMDRSGLRRR